MGSPEIVKEWLDKADEDFNFASINLSKAIVFLLKYVSIFNGLRKNI